MLAAKQGTILITSATSAYRANALNAQFCMSKHALKALVNSVAREHGKNGIHAVNVRIDCAIDGEQAQKFMGDKYDKDAMGSPDEMAETYFWLYQQPKHGWTNEIDLRPYRENWTC